MINLTSPYMQIIPSCVAVKDAGFGLFLLLSSWSDRLVQQSFTYSTFFIRSGCTEQQMHKMFFLMNTITQFSWGSKTQIWKWIPEEANSIIVYESLQSYAF